MIRNLFFSAVLICPSSAVVAGEQSIPAAESVLGKSFDFRRKTTPAPQFFIMESRLIVHAPDGKRVGTDTYRLHLQYKPALAGDEYTCARFTLLPHNGSEVDIPALAGWSYIFKPSEGRKGEVLGIDRSKFDRLVDSSGATLPPDKAYHVYNAFIDFHMFCNVFALPASKGRGIQDLKKIGDKIIHASAFSQPPAGPGSFFKNGEITLEFKGLSSINGQPCALIGYDSGQSSFKMMQTVGSSHYFGDIYKDLASGWVQRATLTEIVVSETTLPAPPHKANAVIERLIELRNVNREEFER